jgi:dephospho-CoA kinase
MAPRAPLAVALTGGIGAGKSEALKAFARHGAAVLSSDEIVHRLLRDDPIVREAVESRFGTSERAGIAEVVFSDRDELAWLEELLHPRVREEYLGWIDGLGDSVGAAVVEVPLLYETGSDELFDAVVVITAPEELRSARTQVPVGQRSGRLIPDAEKVSRADFAFVNDGTLEELDLFIGEVLSQLRR